MIVDTALDIANARSIGADAVVSVMARIMTDVFSLSGAVTEDDLLTAGFTRAEVAIHAGQARDQAAAREAERRRHGQDHEATEAALRAEIADLAKLAVMIDGNVRALKAGLERAATRTVGGAEARE